MKIMEIVLQWLDELDDLVFAGFSLWQGLRRFCLLVASIAALGLHALPPLGVSVERVVALLDVAMFALAVWIVFAALSAGAERSWLGLARRA